jgi:hypothetical protein
LAAATEVFCRSVKIQSNPDEASKPRQIPGGCLRFIVAYPQFHEVPTRIDGRLGCEE